MSLNVKFSFLYNNFPAFFLHSCDDIDIQIPRWTDSGGSRLGEHPENVLLVEVDGSFFFCLTEKFV